MAVRPPSRRLRWARTSFVLLNLGGIACFALYPVAPPRLLPGARFADTVTEGHTFGSWGSAAVNHANSLAAMPSLHFGWALWVSVVLGVIAGSVRVQLVSLVHVVVTLVVIMVTANHYLLDAVGGAILVAVSIPVAGWISRRPGARGQPVAPADAFFWYVDTPTAPQQLGGLLVLDAAATRGEAPDRDRVASVVRGRIDLLPRFRQRVTTPARWRRPRWSDVESIDWEWHVTSRRLSGDSASGEPGMDRLAALVAELQSTPLPRDRPLWRIVVVPGLAGNRSAVILLLHHVMADGLGTVERALRLLDNDLAETAPQSGPRPGRLASTAATMTGLAQLATDGRPSWRVADVDTAERAFGTVDLPLDGVRAVARAHGVRVSDVLLTLVSGALSQTAVLDAPARDRLRVSTTLLVPRSGAGAEGNATGAAMFDLPLGGPTGADRLHTIARFSARTHSGTRALASRFVMDRVCGLLPAGLHAWFARTVYGRRFFQAIFSNLPGPAAQLWFLQMPMTAAYPILPLAPGTPLAVGALGVTNRLGLGISAHPAFLPDMPAFQAAVQASYDEIRALAVPERATGQPQSVT